MIIDLTNSVSEDDDDLLLAEKEQELPPEIEEKRKKGLLRTGLTTGTCAAAATKSSLIAILTGNYVNKVKIKLPKGKIVDLKIEWIKKNDDGSITSAVIKDGGDDPDVTHGAEICSTVFCTPSMAGGGIFIDGGIGVGRVTKPGIGLTIGEAAINPIPRKMIEQSIYEVLSENNISNKEIRVIISVPKGEEIAKKTDNPRLGIIGGISILGTTGIVFPFSTASFAASIRQSLDVAIALGSDTVILTTGGRSEDFAKEKFGNQFPDHAYVQIGDFSGYTVKQCVSKNIKKIIIAGFIGKLTKMAMGVKQTHVRGSHVSMDFLANIAKECEGSSDIIDKIRIANTARHVSEIVNKYNVSGFYDLICKHVYNQMFEHSNKKLDIDVIMFEFDGNICGQYPK